MGSRFHSRIRIGLIALGVLAGLAAPAAAAPLAGVGRAAVAPAADARPDIVNVNHRRYRCFDGWCGSRRHWRNDDWRYRRFRRHHRGHVYVQPGFYFGLPAYRYVAPRRYYGRRLGSAHVAWCYEHYRSYRAWDNTFQPYHGPRRQCWSPFS